MFKRGFVLSIVLVITLLAVLPALADVSNGSFETGDLSGWSIYEDGAGEILVWDGSLETCSDLPSSGITDGSYAMLFDMGEPNTLVAWQDIVVPTDAVLSLNLTYLNEAELWASTGDLDNGGVEGDGGGEGDDNQHLRIDIMDPASSPLSLAGGDIWEILFASNSGTSLEADRQTLSIDLSAYIGETVRLRIAKVDNVGCLTTVIDNVHFGTAPALGYDKISQVRVTAPGTALYDAAGGNPVRDANNQEIWVPNLTADNPFEDVYDVVDTATIDGTTWVQIWLGDYESYPWLPVNGSSVSIID